MPKDDKAVDPSVDVQVISVPAGGTGGQINIPAPAHSGNNGVVVMPLSQIAALPQQSPAAPAVILITVGAAKKEEKKEKKTSSVFQRL